MDLKFVLDNSSSAAVNTLSNMMIYLKAIKYLISDLDLLNRPGA